MYAGRSHAVPVGAAASGAESVAGCTSVVRASKQERGPASSTTTSEGVAPDSDSVPSADEKQQGEHAQEPEEGQVAGGEGAERSGCTKYARMCQGGASAEATTASTMGEAQPAPQSASSCSSCCKAGVESSADLPGHCSEGLVKPEGGMQGSDLGEGAAHTTGSPTDPTSSQPYGWARELVVFSGHKGFVRLAIEQGASLVPVLALGEVLQVGGVAMLGWHGWLDAWVPGAHRPHGWVGWTR